MTRRSPEELDAIFLVSPIPDDPMPMPSMHSFDMESVRDGIRVRISALFDMHPVEAWAKRAVEQKRIVVARSKPTPE